MRRAHRWTTLVVAAVILTTGAELPAERGGAVEPAPSPRVEAGMQASRKVLIDLNYGSLKGGATKSLTTVDTGDTEVSLAGSRLIACTKELRQGILAAFPKAVIGVVNAWTVGPCKDTDVDLTEVERAIQWFLRK